MPLNARMKAAPLPGVPKPDACRKSIRPAQLKRVVGSARKSVANAEHVRGDVNSVFEEFECSHKHGRRNASNKAINNVVAPTGFGRIRAINFQGKLKVLRVA